MPGRCVDSRILPGQQHPAGQGVRVQRQEPSSSPAEQEGFQRGGILRLIAAVAAAAVPVTSHCLQEESPPAARRLNVAPQGGGLSATGEEQSRCGPAVAPGPAAFLQIAFNTLRGPGMDDAADIRLVNAHSICAGCTEHRIPGTEEPLLDQAFLLPFETGVIEADALVPESDAQEPGTALALVPGRAEEDRRARKGGKARPAPPAVPSEEPGEDVIRIRRL